MLYYIIIAQPPPESKMRTCTLGACLAMCVYIYIYIIMVSYNMHTVPWEMFGNDFEQIAH